MSSPNGSNSRPVPLISLEHLAADPQDAQDSPKDLQQWSGVVMERLAPLLREYITTRRWYRAKTRTLRDLVIQDAIFLNGTDSHVVVARIDYTEGTPEIYLIPVSTASTPAGSISNDEILARLVMPGGEEKIIYNALGNQAFTAGLLTAIACNTSFEGRQGALVASRATVFDRDCSDSAPTLKATVSRAEQSNSSIIFEDRYILKVFRKVEPGINPDIEVGTFLTEHHFKNTPAVLGFIEYRPHKGDSMYAAILQAFVPNRGDAWTFTLDSLRGFYERALAHGRSAPPFKSAHPLHLAETEMPGTAREIIGSFLRSASLLGERTAEMHAVLTSDNENPDFRPVPFTADAAASLHEELIKESDTAFDLLRRKEKSLDAESTKLVHTLLGRESQVRKCLASLPHAPVRAVRIRYHGDYHLGQVLATNNDFMIIDFEGEPARPISERREKALALRDVAGMVRSFQYAAYAALRVARGVTAANYAAMESWADYWAAWVSAAYLRAYFDRARRLPFAPGDAKERRTLLDAFLLQKALYEIVYELNNRPDWVPIPLRGLLCLLN